jgi:hypothetical protein
MTKHLGILFFCLLTASLFDLRGVSAQEEPDSAQELPESEAPSPATYQKAPGDDQLIEEMEDHIEEDLYKKNDIDVKARERRRRLKLPPNSPGSRKPEEPPILEQMEDFHAELSDDIVGIADNIDSFFGNDEIIEGRNHTNIRLSEGISILEERGAKNEFDFKFRLKLPQLQERLALEFDDDYDENDVSNNTSRTTRVLRTQRNTGSRGGLAFYQELKGIQTKLTGGLEYKHEVIGYWRFRLMKDLLLSKKKKITFIHDYFDDTIDRKGQTAIINYDYSFSKTKVLRFANEETYRDEFNTFETWHGFSFYHTFNEKTSFAYDYRVKSVNPAGQKNFHLEFHTVDVVYRRLLYRKHLYGEIGPAVFFPKDHDFEALFGITLKLEVIFGNI